MGDSEGILKEDPKLQPLQLKGIQKHSQRKRKSFTDYGTEGGKANPGTDMIERLAKSVQTTIADLILDTDSLQNEKLLRQQARKRFEELLDNASNETLLMLNPLLFRR